MTKPVVLLSVPALREKDVAAMPNLKELMAGGGIAGRIGGIPDGDSDSMKERS